MSILTKFRQKGHQVIEDEYEFAFIETELKAENQKYNSGKVEYFLRSSRDNRITYQRFSRNTRKNQINNPLVTNPIAKKPKFNCASFKKRINGLN